MARPAALLITALLLPAAVTAQVAAPETAGTTPGASTRAGGGAGTCRPWPDCQIFNPVLGRPGLATRPGPEASGLVTRGDDADDLEMELQQAEEAPTPATQTP